MDKIEQELAEIKELILNQKDIFTIEELSRYTGYTIGYIHKLTASYSDTSLPFSKPNGKKLFFEKKAVDEWLMKNRNY